jgi:uncharacterized protein (DUF58 family)
MGCNSIEHAGSVLMWVVVVMVVAAIILLLNAPQSVKLSSSLYRPLREKRKVTILNHFGGVGIFPRYPAARVSSSQQNRPSPASKRE